jgi:hypothetical protein
MAHSTINVTVIVTGMTRPAMRDEVQSRRKRTMMIGGEDQSDEDGVADTGDAVADEVRLVVEGGDIDASREIGAELSDGGGDFVGDGDSVGSRAGSKMLMQDGGLAVGSNDGVNGLGGGDDLGNIGKVDGDAGGRGFDGDGGELIDVGGLIAD